MPGRRVTAATEAARLLGRRGGSVKSEQKAAAVRENGKRGGRPRLVWRGERKDREFRIYATATSWIVETESRRTGTVTDRRVSIPYDNEFPRGLDLNRAWSREYSCAAALVELRSMGPDARELRAGTVVK